MIEIRGSVFNLRVSFLAISSASVMNPPNGQALEGPFDKPSPSRNLAVIVENCTFYVSKEILGLISPVFEKVLYGEFKEAN